MSRRGRDDPRTDCRSRILVVGAGGGLELAYLAERHPGWTFDGVDPSAPMLELARRTARAGAGRVSLRASR